MADLYLSRRSAEARATPRRFVDATTHYRLEVEQTSEPAVGAVYMSREQANARALPSRFIAKSESGNDYYAEEYAWAPTP